jgi:hypothetical protein
MDEDKKVTKSLLNALRVENARLENLLQEHIRREAVLIEDQVVTGRHAVMGLMLAIRHLVKVAPNTQAGVNALIRAQDAFSNYGIPMPTYLHKVPKPRKRRVAKKKRLRREPVTS